MTDLFKDPTQGSSVDLKELKGELVVLVPTASGETDDRFNPGKSKEYVDAALHILTGEKVGDYEPDHRVFQAKLIGSIKRSIDPNGANLVLGRIAQEPTGKGNPAWVLLTATDEDKAIAAKWHAWRVGQGLPLSGKSKATDAVYGGSKPATTPAPAPEPVGAAAGGAYSSEPPF